MDKVDEGVVVVVLYSWNKNGVLIYEWDLGLAVASDENGGEVKAATSMVLFCNWS